MDENACGAGLCKVERRLTYSIMSLPARIFQTGSFLQQPGLPGNFVQGDIT